MGKRMGWFSTALAAASMWLLATARPVTAQDSTVIRLRLGPVFDAHSDVLASPFHQHGVGPDAELSLVRNGFEVALTGGRNRAGSRFETDSTSFEDVWTAAVDVRWWRRVATWGARTDLRLGADLGGFAFVRRHQYGPGYREYYADAALPLSLSVGLGHALGDGGGRLDERVDVGVLTAVLRSSFPGSRDPPTTTWAAPWNAQVFRHRLRLTTEASPHVRLFVTHGLTLFATHGGQPLRIVRQDVSVGVAVARGGRGES